MWGGKKMRKACNDGGRATTTSSYSKFEDFESEIRSRCTCNVSAYRDSSGNVEVEIYDYSNNSYNVEHDKTIIRKTFNKYLGSGRLTINVH